jgi:hypothetical protein
MGKFWPDAKDHLAANRAHRARKPRSGDLKSAVHKCKPSRKNRLNRINSAESNRHMKIKLPLGLLAAASLALSSAAFAGAKTYEVTGPVLEVTDSMIVVQKGKDRWEVNRDANTKVTGDLKVGDKVKITYTMSATDVEVKAGKGAKKEAKATPTP